MKSTISVKKAKSPVLNPRHKQSSGPNSPEDVRNGHVTTFKTSFEDLRKADARHALRRQFSNHFPETYRLPSHDSPSNPDAVHQDPLARSPSTSVESQHPTAKSSSSSMASGNSNTTRLSVVRERNAAIDIEQAINLLQELKKTASPEDLVALHKALLPTRDYTPEPEAPSRSSVLFRAKSMFPPGLATRGGSSVNLFRKQAEVDPPPKPKASKKADPISHARITSNAALDALDLADESANPLPSRSDTPSDQQYSHIGAYRPGTLHITNGAASPDPSVRRMSFEHPANLLASVASSSEQDVQLVAKSPGCVNAVVSALETDSNDQLHRQSTQADHVRPSGHDVSLESNVARTRDPSQSRQYRHERAEENAQGSVVSTARSIESPQNANSPWMRARPSDQSLLVPGENVDAAVRHRLETSYRSMDSMRQSHGSGRVSPVSIDPRFAQRWSHRVSQISQESTREPDESSSPYDEQTAFHEYAQRLSTVYDSEGEDATANETPEAALSKLTGSSNALVHSKPAPHDGRISDCTRLSALERPLTTDGRPRPPQKADSGYGSDSSFRTMPQRISRDLVAMNQLDGSPVTPKKNRMQILGKDEQVLLDDEDVDDARSLYSLQQVLKTPTLLDSMMTPSSRPVVAARKSSPFLRLQNLKRSTPKGGAAPLEAYRASELGGSVSSVEHSPSGDSPTEQRPKQRPSKKLQKPMPDSIRKDRTSSGQKEQKDRKVYDAALQTLAPTPAVPDQLSINLQGRKDPEHESVVKPTGHAYALMKPGESPVVLHNTQTRRTPSVDAEDPAKENQKTLAPTRNRSKSLGRGDGGQADSRGVAAETQTPGRLTFGIGIGRKRSQSGSEPQDVPLKHSSINARPASSKSSGGEASDKNEEHMPLYSDFGSVARTLGSNPYDVSTSQFKRHTVTPSVAMHQLQSPHQISTGLSQAGSGGQRGMDENMARELARSKSRDIAMQNDGQLYDRPRMATPNKRGEASKARAQSVQALPAKAMYHASDWHDKPVFRGTGSSTAGRRHPGLAARPQSMYAESIPPLPELPPDAEIKSSKAAEYVRRMQGNASELVVTAHSPIVPASSQAGVIDDGEKPGYSELSVAEAVKRALHARRALEEVQAKDAARSRPAGPRRQQTSESLEFTATDSCTSLSAASSSRVTISSGTEDTDARPGNTRKQSLEEQKWDEMAVTWRKRRESVGKSLGKPTDEGEEVEAPRPPAHCKSPTIVVSHPSAQYTAEIVHNRKLSASQHAAAYQHLISNDQENIPPDFASPTSNAQTSCDSIQPKKPYTLYQEASFAGPIVRDRSPGGRVITPSGHFYPYTPSAASEADSHRTQTLTPRIPAHTTHQRASALLDPPRRVLHAPSDSLDSLIDRYANRSHTATPSHGEHGRERGSPRVGQQPQPFLLAPPESALPYKKKSADSLLDRYSGGLQYGFERGVGLGGSAGTRNKDDAAARKSMLLSETHGLDLSDVPVFLRRVN